LRSLDAAEAEATTATTTAPVEQVVKTEAMVVLGRTTAAKQPEPTARVEAMVVTRIPKARTETRE
jgi:hypothetical protein